MIRSRYQQTRMSVVEFTSLTSLFVHIHAHYKMKDCLNIDI